MGVVVGIVAFVSELALLLAAGVGGWRLAHDVAGTGVAVAIVAAVGLPLLIAAVWGAWLAPRARWPLGGAARLVTKCALFVATGFLLAGVGLAWWGAALAVVGCAAAAAGRRYPFPGHDKLERSAL